MFIQKRSIKWILSEENLSYSPHNVYLRKCRQVNLLPLSSLFDLYQLIFLHKIIYMLTPVLLPSYLTFYKGTSRLRNSHMDHLSLVSSVSPRIRSNAFSKSFFYRTHCEWNRLPFEIRQTQDHLKFKEDLINYLWKSILSDINDDNSIFDDYGYFFFIFF